MAKRQKVQRFSIQGWEMRHYRETEAYAQAVQSLYDKATLAITRAAARGKIDPDTPFSFDMYPSVQKEMQRITEQLAERVTVVIETGSKKQWLFACDKNDAFLSSIMDTSKLSKSRLKKMQDRNLDALAAFQGRKVDGMNLSQRVWKYVGQYKDQLENALDVGLGEGRSADELSRDVRQNLRDPNRLFRRVRDKRGNLILSKRAAAFHPGRGVYRSSYKNAMRLTRSEINMAYRESDWQRWQSLDFVVGFEIHRSNHEPLCECDICEKLVGRYPKTFKFKGWHPQCMCYATPILMDEETFDENELGDLKAALSGTTYKHQQAKNAVADVPDGFKAWVKDHTEAQKGWASTPYFIKDNFVDGQLGKGLKIAMPTVKKAIIELFKGSTPQEIKDFIIQNIAKSCTLEIKSSDIDLWNDIVNQLNNRIKQFGLEKFGNIGTPRSRNAEASWDEHGNILNLNITALRNKTAIKKAMSYKKRGILYSFAYEDSDDYVRAVIDHELGHLILSKYANVSEVAKLMGDVGKSIMVNGKSFNPINDILGYYASTEEHEFFAEAFSFYMGKNREKLDDRIKGYFERLFSKHGFKIAMPTTTPTGKVDFHVPFDKLSVGEQLKFESELANRNDDDWDLLHACHLYGVDSAWYDSMCKEIYKHRQYWRVPELDAARERLKSQVMAKIAEAKIKAIQAINNYETAIKDAGEWVGDMSYKVVDARDMLRDEESEEYPNYISLLNSANGGSLDASRIRAAIDKVKADYAQAITDANACVAKCGDVDVSQLKALVAEKRTTARNALVIIKDIRNEIAKVEKEWNKKHNGVVKQSYTTNEELNETFKEINADFTTDKWFEHGDLVITPTTKSGVNGFTYMDGRISLKPKRLAGVKSAMGKIGQGKSEDITFEEADAMATFWHEITHNRNKPGNMYTTSTQTDVMEMMNEFVARKTLPEFYAKLGCPKTPHPEFINNRDSTGYNRRVLGYDFVISKLGLDASKVLESAKKNLFALKYTKQETTAYQALMDGGLDKYKCPNGKAIGKAKINKIIAMCRKGYSTTTIEQYMKDEGIIADK